MVSEEKMFKVCLEKSSAKNGYFNALAAFSESIWLVYGKIYKNNDHTFGILH